VSGERDDEDLERLLDAGERELHDDPADPLAALLRAATAPKAEPGPDHTLDGEEAAVAAFRTAALAPRPAHTATPRRRPIRRVRALTGTTAALSAVALLALAATALPQRAARNPQPAASLTPSSTQLTPPPPNPTASNTAALPLDDNATITTTTHSAPTSSTHTSATPSVSDHGHATKTPPGQRAHEHTAKAGRKGA
jgi:hypothetical protein